MFRLTQNFVLFLMAVLFVLFGCEVAVAGNLDAKLSTSTVGGGHTWGKRIIAEIVKNYNLTCPQKSVIYRPWEDFENIKKFHQSKYSILVHYNIDDLRLFGEKGGRQTNVFLIGVFRVKIIADASFMLDEMMVSELQLFLSGKIDKLSDIQCVGMPRDWLGWDVLQHTCMLTGTCLAEGFAAYRDDIKYLEDAASVIKYVRRHKKSIGIIASTDFKEQHGLKFLSINGYMPYQQQGTYASFPEQVKSFIEEPIFLFSSPQNTTAVEFCEFAAGPEGSAIAEKFGLITPRMQFEAESKARLADLKSGKGEKVAACGAVGGSNALAGRAVREMMGGLAEEFVRAKAVVQVGYTPMATDVAGIGAFLATTGVGEAMRPRQELLLLDDRPSERAMQAHGERWNALGKLRAAAPRAAVDDDTSPRAIDGAGGNVHSHPPGESAGVAVVEAVGYDDGPVEYLIAARGVAVIVNPSNKLNSLTLDQLRSVFSGELQDWSILAGGAGGGGGAGKQEIKLFGLPQADVVTQIFANECLATDKWRRVTIRKSSDEVIKAVASDPAAIGIVDLATVGPVALAGLQSETAASAAGRSVKLLSIDLGRAAGGTGGAGGLRGAAMPPLPAIPATADNLKNAMYPLSQRLYLYVHPLASDTAKDFAKFAATCGASEATPYADTVKSMIETYQKNGLIPLADEAINRMAKDALAAATKED